MIAAPITVSYQWPETLENIKEIRGIVWIAIDKGLFLESINDKESLWIAIGIIVALFILLFLIFILFVWFCFYKIASYSLKPIRILNSKIKYLFQSDKELDLNSANLKITSKEAHCMFESFSELLITRKFAQNEINKNDAIAIMDFANAYTVLNDNEQAKGICLTNIAHIHFNNKNYSKAAKSYKEAADLANLIMNQAKIEGRDDDYHKNLYVFRK